MHDDDTRTSAPTRPRTWRSLEELQQAPDFEEWLHREFPREAAVWPEGVDRRSFLKLSGASLALGGLTACTRQPLEKIVPYAGQVEQIVPGKPLYFATGFPLDGYASGILVESHMGRPTKIEGNPEHPASRGKTSALAQAAILEMYDPDRSKVVSQLGRIRTWSTFVDETRRAINALEALQGARIRILSETVTSPSLAAEIQRVLETYPLAGWVQYDPVTRDEARMAAQTAFGQALDVRYDLEKADVVLSLDSDFLTSGPGHVAYAGAFAARRRVRQDGDSMNRLYAVESTPQLTGTMADHRLSASTIDIGRFTTALAARLGVEGLQPVNYSVGDLAGWIEPVADDLEAHAGRCLVVAGEHASAQLQTLVHAINAHLGNFGETVITTEAIESEPSQQAPALSALVQEMQAGEVDVLVILGGNPVYNAPADLQFAEAMQNVGRRIRLGLYEDETSEYCQWHVPQAHFLESWGDARAFDGTVTLNQPLIEPLYSGHTATELMGIFGTDGEVDGEEILKAYWEANGPAAGNGDFAGSWRRWLHDGYIPGTEAATVDVALVPGVAGKAAVELNALMPPSPDKPEITFRPDPTIWDGRFANNGWLQECPKPFSKLTWDNALLLSPAMAKHLGVATEQLVDITVGDRTLQAAAWIHPGQPDATVTLHLGYGRWRAGDTGSGKGFNAYELRTSRRVWQSMGVTLSAGTGTYSLASTQLHHNMELETTESESRHLVRHGTMTHYHEEPAFARHMGHTPPDDLSMFPAWEYGDHAWGMTVDLSACTGCNACLVSCQAENNIPIVGKDQVAAGREMHWIRVDRYYEGSLAAPTIHHQPVMCQHCENAPCEVVCPVGATVHSDEGLNDMVYNRCVGTRYCANNCPYKVRRFNFLLYSDFETPVTKLMHNPDVTVRSRGVMEKCSYCVQRINEARMQAKREDRSIRDRDIVTACEQACPSEAIVFGDINDPESRVARLQDNDLSYGILEDLGTRPRTTYLAKLRNPNPALVPESTSDDHGAAH
jgi:molybdopterin-containing oxidoreductase family iron-sulfur binding subunit